MPHTSREKRHVDPASRRTGESEKRRVFLELLQDVENSDLPSEDKKEMIKRLRHAFQKFPLHPAESHRKHS